MTVEYLALLGIIVFCFMAISSLVAAVRSFTRARSIKYIRPRRLIGSPDAARSVAESIAREIAQKNPDHVSIARETGKPEGVLSDAIADGRRYYLSRVEAIHCELFSQAVDEIVLDRSSKK